MILPFGISWLCSLLWGCICFPPLKGYNIAHGYSLNDDGFNSNAGVLSPQTSNQFYSGASLNTNHDSVSPRDKMHEMQAMRHQSFVSPQRDLVHHESNEDASSVTSLSEEMVQSEPDMFPVVPSAPSVQKYEHESSGYQHPFGLLVKDNAQQKTMEGISFPTIKDFKRVIETMKSSFLTPGSDLRRHFQTAREIMENKVASNAENIKGKPDVGYRSNPAKEGSAHDDASEYEGWSEPMNTVFEQREQGANYQMSSEILSAPDPVDSIASLISTTLYENQGSGPGSILYTRPHLAATEHVSSNYGSFDNDISGENPDIFTTSSSHKLSEQMPSGTFFGEHFSFSGHVTASPVNPQNSPSQDFSHYSRKTSNITPLTSEKSLPKPTYSPNNKDSLTGYQNPSGGFELGDDFQREELGRVTPANVLSAPNPPSLKFYGKSLYVSAPRRQHYNLDYLPKHRERPAPTFQPHQPTVVRKSKDINYAPIVHQPVSRDSVSLSSDSLSPQNSRAHVGVKTSSPHDAQNQAFNRKQPVRYPRVFTVKPSSSLNGYLRDQTVRVTHPSNLTDQAKDGERSDLSEHNPVSVIQEPKEMTENTLIAISGGLDSTLTGISSLVRGEYESFNSPTNLAPSSETAFSRLYGNGVMSRNFEIKNIVSDRFPTGNTHGARNSMGSFSTPQRRGISLNGGYIGTTRAGFPQAFNQPTKVRKRPANVNKEPGNMAYQPPKPLSASKVSGSTLSGVFWRNGSNTKRLPLKMSPSKSTPSVNAYVVKSRNSYVRSKVSLSKTHYAPYQLDGDKTGGQRWKPAPRQRKYRNTVSHDAKGSEEK